MINKRHIVIMLVMMVACMVGRNFVANATFASFNAKPRACAINHNQIDVCKETIEKQGAQHQVDVPKPVLHVPPPVAIFSDQIGLALHDYDDNYFFVSSPPRAPPLLSC